MIKKQKINKYHIIFFLIKNNLKIIIIKIIKIFKNNLNINNFINIF